ncbi:MAG TPA: AI-2E family transporter [Novosphingobium sp.]|nr:AI-2E family transporter [Novosphingobium sp.]
MQMGSETEIGAAEIPAQTAQHSPTDIRDPRLRHEAHKASIWIGIALLAGLVVFFAQPLMVILGGIVFATMIDGGARLLGRVLPIRRGARIAIVMVLALLFLVWTVSYAGSQIARQAAEMPAIVEFQFQRLTAWAETHGIAIDAGDINGLARQMVTGVGPVTRALGGIIGGAATLLLITILGIYIALEPRLYERGVAWMLPVDERPHLRETVGRMGFALRRLLAGRLLGMVIEGVATWLALWAYGVPMAALLGLLTGLLAFLPNIGAPVSGALMIMVGFSGGTDMGLFCIAVYIVVQVVDSNVIIPMVAKKTVDLAPALVLGAQLVFGVMFGILGLALADPIVAMVKILLERRTERNAADAAAEV